MIPNIISLFRIFVVIPVVFFVLNDKFYYAMLLFFVAGISDFFDGYFARKFNQETSFGALLDPIADKILVVTLSVVFMYKSLLPEWFVFVIVLRDILILCGGWYLLKFKNITDLYPFMISKLNTCFVLFLIIDVFLLQIFGDEVFLNLKEGLIFLTTVTTFLSFFLYFKRAVDLCKR